MVFFDVSSKNTSAQYAKANGTFSQVLRMNSELGIALIRLPSGRKLYLPINSLCTLGRNSNIFSKFTVFGKAGTSQNIGRNVVVRGVAMNPIDHPHGGRTKTNKPEVSPWG